MTEFVLGPSIDGVTEPVPVPPAPPVPQRITVAFGTVATTAGGNVWLTIDETATGVRPVNLIAYFVPSGSQPTGNEHTVDTFMQSNWLHGIVSVPLTGPLADGGRIQVVGVNPGVYYVQIILEYPVQ